VAAEIEHDCDVDEADRLCLAQAQLQKRAALARLQGRDIDADEHLVWQQGCAADAKEELVERQGAFAPLCAGQGHRCIHGPQRRNGVVGGAGGDQVAGNRAAVANLRRTDEPASTS